MTGQTVSPRAFVRRDLGDPLPRRAASTTAKTSSTVRPEAAMRSRSAALISRIAAGRSSGVVSQCGSGWVSGAGAEVDASRQYVSFELGLLTMKTVRRLRALGKSPD